MSAQQTSQLNKSPNFGGFSDPHTSIDEILDDIIKHNKLHRFASELGSTTDQYRKAELKEVIRILEGTSKYNFETSAKSKLNQIYDKIYNDTLHWKWTKLSIPQQRDRIKDYLKNTIVDTIKRESAEKLLIGLVDNEKLKKTAIAYDTEKGQITGIFLKEYQEIIQDSESESEDENEEESNESSESGDSE